MNDYARQLESARKESGVTGASFAHWDGSKLHTAVSGLRNSVTGDPVTTDTVMHIGSITKVFNTVLLMQLVDDGKISLDDPVVKHLPNLRLGDLKALQKITCKMLVNHTSGIDLDAPADQGPDKERIVDAVSRLSDVGQLHPPGEGPSYCNPATVIAGHLTQTLRGESWYTLVKTRIFEPLGMRHAMADLTDLPKFRASVGDVTDPATHKLVQTTRPFLAVGYAPAGATLMMSATDLVTFARALINGGVGPNGARILSSASAARMAQPTIAMLEPPEHYWGLGWSLQPGGVVHHSGGGPGVSSTLYAHAPSGRVVALLTNCDRHDALKPAMIDPMLEAWTGIKPKVPQRQSGKVDPKPYEGMYQNSLFRVEVLSRDGGLAVRMSFRLAIYDNSGAEGPTTPLYPLGNDLFEVTGIVAGFGRTELKFAKPDANGRMQAMGFGARMLARAP